MVTATFRFYGELNDFLPPARRKIAFDACCAEDATAKHMIEALGIPHTEVELILVNGQPAGFGHRLAEADRIAVYPKFQALDIAPLLRLRQRPPGIPRFVADAHLGGLARLLRLAGFDTLYDNRYEDDEIEALAIREGRIVLSRDLELLKRRRIDHGCFIRAVEPKAQLRELAGRQDLVGMARPFSRCLCCNTALREVAKAEVLDRLPAAMRTGQARFRTCDGCGWVYWEGSHWRAMRQVLGDTLRARPIR